MNLANGSMNIFSYSFQNFSPNTKKSITGITCIAEKSKSRISVYPAPRDGVAST